MLLEKEGRKEEELNRFEYRMRRTSRAGGDRQVGTEVGRAPAGRQLRAPHLCDDGP